MATDLHALADQVENEEDFLAFVSALSTDWEEERAIEEKSPIGPYSSGALGWENCSVGAMLEAAAAWGESSISGLPLYEKPTNPWRRVSQILHAGKFYE